MAIVRAIAMLVFPIPEIPVKRYACGSFSLEIACFRNSLALSWLSIWENEISGITYESFVDYYWLLNTIYFYVTV